MDINTFRGIVTGVLLLLFLWLIAWSWSKRRQHAFDAASSVPLEDDNGAPLADEGRAP